MENNKGWVALYRTICENDIWFLEPFTKAQAWIDLVLNANHSSGVINIRGNMVNIERGQIGWSEITMANRWKWSRNKVRRYLKWLETKQQIAQQKVYRLTSITTIINYDRYQSAQQTEQQTIQQKDNRRYTNNNDNNVNNNKEGDGQSTDSNEEQLSNDKATPSYGNPNVKDLKKFLIEKYPKPLDGISDNRKIWTLRQIFNKRKNQDEWMDENWKKNVTTFMTGYVIDADDKFLVGSVDKLREKAKLWREYRGKFN